MLAYSVEAVLRYTRYFAAPVTLLHVIFTPVETFVSFEITGAATYLFDFSAENPLAGLLFESRQRNL